MNDCPLCCRLQLKCDGTRWRTGEEVKGKLRMEWVASILHTISEHGVPSITTADAHTSDTSSRLNWRHRRFKWTRPFRRKTKSCPITFQLVSTLKQTMLSPLRKAWLFSCLRYNPRTDVITKTFCKEIGFNSLCQHNPIQSPWSWWKYVVPKRPN